MPSIKDIRIYILPIDWIHQLELFLAMVHTEMLLILHSPRFAPLERSPLREDVVYRLQDVAHNILDWVDRWIVVMLV